MHLLSAWLVYEDYTGLYRRNIHFTVIVPPTGSEKRDGQHGRVARNRGARVQAFTVVQEDETRG